MKRTPIRVKTHANCRYSECGKEFRKHKTTDKYCSYACEIADNGFPEKKKSKPIPKVSVKRKSMNEQYSVLRKEFLSKPENIICFIDGCNEKSTTIEHRAGRWGSNFLDTSTWAGCCLKHNLELENNPELSKKYQLSKITGNKKI